MSSLLIIPVYLDPIDNVQDMLNSPSELVVPIGTAVVEMLDTDPRPGVQTLNKIYTPKALSGGNFADKDVHKSLESGAMTTIVPKLFLTGNKHFGRENLFATPASNGVVAKGSLLKVIRYINNVPNLQGVSGFV